MLRFMTGRAWFANFESLGFLVRVGGEPQGISGNKTAPRPLSVLRSCLVTLGEHMTERFETLRPCRECTHKACAKVRKIWKIKADSKAEVRNA